MRKQALLAIFGLAVLGSACAVPAEGSRASGDVAEGATGDEAGTTEPSGLFEVRLSGGETAEAMQAQILQAGHEQLAAACRTSPAGAIRVVNPLDSERYMDVPCASILSDERAVDAEQPLTSESVGEARQEWSPLGLACSLGFAGVGFGMTEVCSSHAPGSSSCPYTTSGTVAVIAAVLCSFL